MFAPCKFYDINKGMHIRDFGFNPDIEEWFEARACNYMEDGKKVHGFELLALKKN